MRAAYFFSRFVAVLIAAPLVSVLGQGDSASQSQTLLFAYQAEQAVLAQAEQSLIDGGATPAQLEAWRDQNAPSFAAQRKLAQQMALQAALDYMSLPGPAAIPADASPALATFLTTQATCASITAQIHNQLLQALPGDVTADDILQLEQQQAQLVQQQLAAEFAPQTQLAQPLAEEGAGQIMPLPEPLQIPADATPQLRAYLIARDQLMRAEISAHNQYAATDPATCQAAVQQWRQQNASLFEQLQQLAIALTQHR